MFDLISVENDIKSKNRTKPPVFDFTHQKLIMYLDNHCHMSLIDTKDYFCYTIIFVIQLVL